MFVLVKQADVKCKYLANLSKSILYDLMKCCGTSIWFCAVVGGGGTKFHIEYCMYAMNLFLYIIIREYSSDSFWCLAKKILLHIIMYSSKNERKKIYFDTKARGVYILFVPRDRQLSISKLYHNFFHIERCGALVAKFVYKNRNFLK